MRIEERRAVAAFADTLRRRLVLYVAGCDRSVAELAQLTGVEIKRVHYHVTQLLSLGLIRVSGGHARAGRAIKRYRAIAEAFFIPDYVVDIDPWRILQVELKERLSEAMDQTRTGTLYSVDDQGMPRMTPVRDRAQKASIALERWHVLRLQKDDARQLTSEINRVFDAYLLRQDSTAPPYFLHVAIAPSNGR